jgi:hypothetical protein
MDYCRCDRSTASNGLLQMRPINHYLLLRACVRVHVAFRVPSAGRHDDERVALSWLAVTMATKVAKSKRPHMGAKTRTGHTQLPAAGETNLSTRLPARNCERIVDKMAEEKCDDGTETWRKMRKGSAKRKTETKARERSEHGSAQCC